MKKIIILFCFAASVQTAFAQNSNYRRDSLYQRLKQVQTPAEQIDVWADIAEAYSYTGKPDSVQFVAGQMLKIATDAHQDSLLARAYLQIGKLLSRC